MHGLLFMSHVGKENHVCMYIYLCLEETNEVLHLHNQYLLLELIRIINQEWEQYNDNQLDIPNLNLIYDLGK